MTLSDEIEMVEGHGTMNPYVFFMAGIPRLCIPDMGLDDGPNGVADGLTGVTALPSILAFIPAWLTATGIQVFSLISPLTPPISYMAYGIGGFMGLGVVYLVVLWRRDRRRVVDVGIVHLDQSVEEAEEEPPPSR